MARRGYMTLQEAVAAIEELQDNEESECIDLVVIPPELDQLSDEEELDTDDLENDLRQTDVAGSLEIHQPNTGDPILTIPKTAKCKSKKKKDVNWSQPTNVVYSSMPIDKQHEKTEALELQIGGDTAIQLFERFFDNEVLDLILTQSNLYANQNNRHNFLLEKYQLQRFIGFLLLTGYHELPRERMYWEHSEDVSLPIVRKAMSKHQFGEMKRNIHLCNNDNIDKDDKMFKIREYYSLLNNKFSQFGAVETCLSIDEQMVPYFGRHGSKMFIRGKPVRFGFKLWCLCTSTGYILKVLPYAGKSEYVDPALGLGASVVKELLRAIPVSGDHAVFFDNFFTSHTLLEQLRVDGFHATGTIRENRIINSPLIESKKMDKEPRGTFDWSFDKDAEVLVVKWKDNSNVCLATNFEKVLPTQPVKRFCRKQKEMVNVNQPNMINSYNRFMGGVDLHDNFISKYRVRIKGKKWWWPLFTNLIDASLVNAWRLHRTIRPKGDDLLCFRRKVAVALLHTMQPITSMAKEPQHTRPGPISSLTRIGNTSGSNHSILKTNKRLRCRQCKSQTIFVCKSCNVGVHPKCFDRFHRAT